MAASKIPRDKRLIRVLTDGSPVSMERDFAGSWASILLLRQARGTVLESMGKPERPCDFYLLILFPVCLAADPCEMQGGKMP